MSPFPVLLILEFVDELKDAEAMCTPYSSSVKITIMRQEDFMEECTNLLHEVVHAVRFLQDIVQTRFDVETEAYLAEDIWKWTVDCLAKDRAKR